MKTTLPTETIETMSKRHLLTSGELAAELGIAPRTVARYARDGLLTPAETTLGGHYRWDLDDVRRQMRELRERGAQTDDGPAGS